MLQLIQQNYQKVLAYQSQRGTNDGFDKKNGLLDVYESESSCALLKNEKIEDIIETIVARFKNAGKITKELADTLAVEQYEIYNKNRLEFDAGQESLADDKELKAIEEKTRKRQKK